MRVVDLDHGVEEETPGVGEDMCEDRVAIDRCGELGGHLDSLLVADLTCAEKKGDETSCFIALEVKHLQLRSVQRLPTARCAIQARWRVWSSVHRLRCPLWCSPVARWPDR